MRPKIFKYSNRIREIRIKSRDLFQGNIDQFHQELGRRQLRVNKRGVRRRVSLNFVLLRVRNGRQRGELGRGIGNLNSSVGPNPGVRRMQLG